MGCAGSSGVPIEDLVPVLTQLIIDRYDGKIKPKFAEEQAIWQKARQEADAELKAAADAKAAAKAAKAKAAAAKKSATPTKTSAKAAAPEARSVDTRAGGWKQRGEEVRVLCLRIITSFLPGH